jgi:hypothetical protein
LKKSPVINKKACSRKEKNLFENKLFVLGHYKVNNVKSPRNPKPRTLFPLTFFLGLKKWDFFPIVLIPGYVLVVSVLYVQ